MTAQIKYEDKPWLARYEKGVPENIDYEQITLPEYLENSARQYPERTALICEKFKISYRRLNEMANRDVALVGSLSYLLMFVLIAVLLRSVVSLLATVTVIALTSMITLGRLPCPGAGMSPGMMLLETTGERWLPEGERTRGTEASDEGRGSDDELSERLRLR